MKPIHITIADPEELRAYALAILLLEEVGGGGGLPDSMDEIREAADYEGVGGFVLPFLKLYLENNGLPSDEAIEASMERWGKVLWEVKQRQEMAANPGLARRILRWMKP